MCTITATFLRQLVPKAFLVQHAVVKDYGSCNLLCSDLGLLGLCFHVTAKYRCQSSWAVSL